ncbi:hypothetical protein LCGC14_0914780 [marine sediment metagenome]|uniref:Uncharacterized protein n=1 Tax=marine sediment metagenome TaxID=412755 RepID=A0A0F9NXA7_9ZZZZ
MNLLVGSIVHYILGDGPSKGECRPAIVVKIWHEETGSAQLIVFMDGTNDGMDPGYHILWATSVLPGNYGGEWHFIGECEQ